MENEVRPDPQDADELHDLLVTAVGLTPTEAWRSWFDQLVEERRAVTVHLGNETRWGAVERRTSLELLFPHATVVPDHRFTLGSGPSDRDSAAAEMVRGHLEYRGPSTCTQLSSATGLLEPDVLMALNRLEAEGSVLRGHFTDANGEEFCARRLLARIHSYSRQRLRREIEPV
ncbi:MAG TPA: ATP-dependent DNA helicase, partial [Actinomycetota bacterium]|nr:ATP-dependent DNA helicase [Actinomycetota bacterium]